MAKRDPAAARRRAEDRARHRRLRDRRRAGRIVVAIEIDEVQFIQAALAASLIEREDRAALAAAAAEVVRRWAVDFMHDASDSRIVPLCPPTAAEIEDNDDQPQVRHAFADR